MGAKESKSKITNRSVYVKYNPTLVDYVDLVRSNSLNYQISS